MEFRNRFCLLVYTWSSISSFVLSNFVVSSSRTLERKSVFFDLIEELLRAKLPFWDYYLLKLGESRVTLLLGGGLGALG